MGDKVDSRLQKLSKAIELGLAHEVKTMLQDDGIIAALCRTADETSEKGCSLIEFALEQKKANGEIIDLLCNACPQFSLGQNDGWNEGTLIAALFKTFGRQSQGSCKPNASSFKQAAASLLVGSSMKPDEKGNLPLHNICLVIKSFSCHGKTEKTNRIRTKKIQLFDEMIAMLSPAVEKLLVEDPSRLFYVAKSGKNIMTGLTLKSGEALLSHNDAVTLRCLTKDIGGYGWRKRDIFGTINGPKGQKLQHSLQKNLFLALVGIPTQYCGSSNSSDLLFQLPRKVFQILVAKPIPILGLPSSYQCHMESQAAARPGTAKSCNVYHHRSLSFFAPAFHLNDAKKILRYAAFKNHQAGCENTMMHDLLLGAGLTCNIYLSGDESCLKYLPSETFYLIDVKTSFKRPKKDRVEDASSIVIAKKISQCTMKNSKQGSLGPNGWKEHNSRIVSILKYVMSLDPDHTKKCNAHGEYPLHIAVAYQCSFDIIQLVAENHHEAFSVPFPNQETTFYPFMLAASYSIMEKHSGAFQWKNLDATFYLLQKFLAYGSILSFTGKSKDLENGTSSLNK